MNIKLHGVNSQIENVEHDELPNEILPIPEPKAECIEAKAEPSEPKAEPKAEAEDEEEKRWDWGSLAFSFLGGILVGSTLQPPRSRFDGF